MILKRKPTVADSPHQLARKISTYCRWRGLVFHSRNNRERNGHLISIDSSHLTLKNYLDEHSPLWMPQWLHVNSNQKSTELSVSASEIKITKYFFSKGYEMLLNQ